MITDISKIDVKRLAARTSGLKNKKATIKEEDHKQMSSNIQMMEVYRSDWDSLSGMRKRFQRAARYNEGEQWKDIIIVDGVAMTEEQNLINQGRPPLKQNLIRPMAKSLTGLFRSDTSKSVVVSRKPDSANIEKMLSNALQYALTINKTRITDPRTFDLFILSGLPVQRIGYDYLEELKRYDVRVDYIDPQYVFFNTDIKDARGTDIRRFGALHDLIHDELYVAFAKNEADKKILRDIYSGVTEYELTTTYGLDGGHGEDLSFYIPVQAHHCRVIEVWEKRATDVIDIWDKASGFEGYWDGTLSELEQENATRIQRFIAEGVDPKMWENYLIHYDSSIAFKWYYKYLSPLGHVLREGETPFEHGMHPFVTYPYPLINGKIWGVIFDILDQQKLINRNYILTDFIINTSAKNTLVLDKASIDGQNPEDLADTYREVGGVMVLDLKGGAKAPQELTGRMQFAGLTEMIGMQIKLMQDIVGVQPAMQGQTGAAGTPASKFAMEIEQSSLNNKDMIESFKDFLKDRDTKVLQTIIQFYKSKRYLAISGKDGAQLYDPELLVDEASEFDLTIAKGIDSPTYKGWIDEMLKEFVVGGLIDMELFLTHSNLPFAQSMLEDLKNKREQVATGAISPGEAVGQVQQNYQQQSGVNPQNVQGLQNIISK